MKILPCSNRGCRGQATLIGGSPYYLKSWPGDLTLSYVCSGCKTHNVLALGEYHRLPEVSIPELLDKGVSTWDLLEHVHQLHPSHVADLFQAGFSPDEIARMARDGEKRTSFMASR